MGSLDPSSVIRVILITLFDKPIYERNIMENNKKITSSKEVNKKSETFLHLKNELLKSHQNELDTLVDEIISKRKEEDENLKKKIWSKHGLELPDQFIIRESDDDDFTDYRVMEDEYYKVKGVSDDGMYINPDFVTDEDQIVKLKVYKIVEHHIDVRVHKDIKRFNVDEFVDREEIQNVHWDYEYLKHGEFLENSEQHIEVLDSHKVNGKEDPDSRDYYVCDDGVFYHERGID